MSLPCCQLDRTSSALEIGHDHADGFAEHLGRSEFDDLGTVVVDRNVSWRDVVGVTRRVDLGSTPDPELHGAGDDVPQPSELALAVGQALEEWPEVLI